MRAGTLATERLYYHRNQQYSVTALTDTTGTISERYAYDAYGKLTVLAGGGTVPVRRMGTVTPIPDASGTRNLVSITTGRGCTIRWRGGFVRVIRLGLREALGTYSSTLVRRPLLTWIQVGNRALSR
ncbi:hypothetical protein FF011L_30240 [Roseimaritima multifibrata]|uniref:RHS Repeat protein n=1 Tax=Roseimaritima multifibrata TaxID=1930274 RepID=A0A517MH86_9BACT|nr:hypothetical protein [Roseimaritima multifibrata]QDS94245.1 hypothetical protein FF011L_30240 [Roseimaritima multifibrata]